MYHFSFKMKTNNAQNFALLPTTYTCGCGCTQERMITFYQIETPYPVYTGDTASDITANPPSHQWRAFGEVVAKCLPRIVSQRTLIVHAGLFLAWCGCIIIIYMLLFCSRISLCESWVQFRRVHTHTRNHKISPAFYYSAYRRVFVLFVIFIYIILSETKAHGSIARYIMAYIHQTYSIAHAKIRDGQGAIHPVKTLVPLVIV